CTATMMLSAITNDSASMFNKSLELIETKEFFGISPKKIEVVVHPESMIHALVGFRDGALMAHIGPPDMRHAIGYALNWPDRRHLPVERLDLAKVAKLSFRAPDEVRWPALGLARRVMERGGLSGAVFNAAKEVALDGFIDQQIRFTEMAPVVGHVLDMLEAENALHCDTLNLDRVLEADQVARSKATEAIKKRQGAH
ncbi:MAG: 1-deoxy-D-xylulose-5-phosphate reductoisomerase, partial [Pseudomonadota bacterium]